MFRRFKRKLLNYILSSLFNAVTEKDAIHFIGKDLIIKGEVVNHNQRKTLASESKVLLQSNIWFLIKTEMEMAANRKMYQSSTKDEDIVFGKAMLYNLDLIDQKIKKLSLADK